jgi:competence ComEA-like helix-hairpin-helix protein
MTRQNGSVGGVKAPDIHSRDKRVLVLFILGGLLLFLFPWLNQQRVMPTQVNQYIHDGQHLYVQRVGTINTDKTSTEAGSLKRVGTHHIGITTATASQLVSPAVLSQFFNLGFPLNIATTEELELLPGIGPSLARQIHTHRTQFGNFTSINELQAVPGIGEKTVQRLQPLLDFNQ